MNGPVIFFGLLDSLLLCQLALVLISFRPGRCPKPRLEFLTAEEALQMEGRAGSLRAAPRFAPYGLAGLRLQRR